MSKKRINEIEACVELYSTDGVMFRPSELYELSNSYRKTLDNHNIYLIGRRPRVSIDPKSVSLDVNLQTVNGNLIIHLPAEKKQISFSLHSPFASNITRVECHEYPHNYLLFGFENQADAAFRLIDLHRYIDNPNALISYSELNIEYVGQAFGKDGERDAIDRLIGETKKAGHGSLQKIQADINSKYPDDETYVILYSFEFYKNIVFGGGNISPEVDFESAPDRVATFFDNELSRKERIDLVEASLIRYFKPLYNEIYKKTFPLVSHKILDRLFELDVTGLSVSLSTMESKISLKSVAIAASCCHFSKYSITNQADRLTFFDLCMPDE